MSAVENRIIQNTKLEETKDLINVQASCRTCQIEFATWNGQREHHRGDWHRYNVCRRAAELAPLTHLQFDQRSKAAIERAAQEKAEEQVKAETFFKCSLCSSTYLSKNALSTHLSSKKHKEKIREYRKNNNTSNDDGIVEKHLNKNNRNKIITINNAKSNEEEVALRIKNRVKITLLDCLFCSSNKSSFESFEKNIEHMQEKHSFYIQSNCINIKGLFKYISSKLSVGLACLQCHSPASPESGLFSSLQAVRNHMECLGHYALPKSDRILEQFFEKQSISSISLSTALGINNNNIIKLEESESESSSDYEDEDYKEQLNQFYIDEALQLVLPSGVTLGNRLLKKYYKQNIPKTEDLESFNNKLPKIFEITPITIEAARCDRQNNRRRQRAYLEVAVKANKLQHHFRDQMLQ